MKFLQQYLQFINYIETEAFDILAVMEGRSAPGRISEIYKVGENIDKNNRFTLVNRFIDSAGICNSA